MKNIHFWIIGIFLLPIAVSEVTVPIPLGDNSAVPMFTALFLMLLLTFLIRSVWMSRSMGFCLFAITAISVMLYASMPFRETSMLLMFLGFIIALLIALWVGIKSAHFCLVERVRLARYHVWVMRFMFWTPALSIAGYLLLQNTSQPEIRFLPIAIGVLTPIVLRKFVTRALKDE